MRLIGSKFFIVDVEADKAASTKEKKRIKKLRAPVSHLRLRLSSTGCLFFSKLTLSSIYIYLKEAEIARGKGVLWRWYAQAAQPPAAGPM